MAGLAALAAGAAAVLAGVQAGRLTGPLSQLARAAHALGHGNFAVRERPSGVAEVDAVATALADTAARIEDLLARERAFSTRASHQLRTPLTGLRLTLEAALAGGDTGLRPAAASAVDSADVLARTIDELLLLTRAPGRSEPLDTEALLEELRRERTGSLAAQGRPLRIATEPSLPTVTASRAAVKQVLAVLLDNAAEHGAGTITIRVRSADTGLALDVADEGEGFGAQDGAPDDAAPRGLGLPLARSLAEAEGGRLVVTRPGRHPVLTLFLPAPDPDAAGEKPDA
jgi:signal transduction histidine kinase